MSYCLFAFQSKIKSIIKIFFIITFLFTSQVSAQNYKKGIEDYLQQVMNNEGIPGLSAAVAVDGEIIYSGGIGYAELDNLAPSTGTSVHNIASISKMHAVVALMQLFEQGKLNLDAEIQKYVPYFPKKRYPVTVRSILTHTSGIRHYEDGEFGEQEVYQKMHYNTLEEGIKIFKDDSLRFKPGEYWSYSSYAFNLTQGIIENISGMGFEEYLKIYVWQPAGLTNTQFDVPDRIVHKRGKGYRRTSDGQLRNIDYVDVSYKYAGGGIISTSEDLVKFAIALNNGTLLKPETVKLMYTVQYENILNFNDGNPKELEHQPALGWFIRTDAQNRTFPSHTGSVKGTKSVLINYLDLNVIVALIGNVNTFSPLDYGKAIAQIFLPPVNEGYQLNKSR